MHVSRLLVALPALAIALLANSAWAWNDTGHKTTALLAWDDLTPATRAKIVALLPKHPQYASLIKSKGATGEDAQILDLMTAATWADQVRTENAANKPYNHPEWHLTVFPFITGNLPADKRPTAMSADWKPGTTPGNIMQALKKWEAEIQDSKAADDQKAVALTWILHLTGDIHQPLHTTSWYSEEHPAGEGDRRGNYTYVNTGSSNTSLHSYWDSAVPAYVNLEASRKVVEQLKKENPRGAFAEALQVTDFEKWGRESHALCTSFVYMDGKIPHGVSAQDKIPVLPKSYLDDSKPLMRRRLTLAGYRLADQLNRLFAGSSAAPEQPAN